MTMSTMKPRVTSFALHSSLSTTSSARSRTTTRSASRSASRGKGSTRSVFWTDWKFT
jgi:hypothetical protein